MTFKCIFSGHQYEQYENVWNNGTFFVCLRCCSTKWRASIRIKDKEK